MESFAPHGLGNIELALKSEGIPVTNVEETKPMGNEDADGILSTAIRPGIDLSDKRKRKHVQSQESNLR